MKCDASEVVGASCSRCLRKGVNCEIIKSRGRIIQPTSVFNSLLSTVLSSHGFRKSQLLRDNVDLRRKLTDQIGQRNVSAPNAQEERSPPADPPPVNNDQSGSSIAAIPQGPLIPYDTSVLPSELSPTSITYCLEL